MELYALLPERGEGALVAAALPPPAHVLELGCGCSRICPTARSASTRRSRAALSEGGFALERWVDRERGWFTARRAS
ncbi:MAG TPA: hypothetical protein VFA30_08360 [Gaiellaceae bacterium]|nr:hypothetical protein [Gaiellaceae bacterium]